MAGSIPNRANDPKRKAGLYTPGQIAKGEHMPRSKPLTPRALQEKHDKQLPNRDIYKKQPPKL